MRPASRACQSLLASASLAVAIACGSEPPAPTPIPEPEQALRDPQDRGRVPAAARIADYHIDATLDDEAHKIDGQVRVTWRNTTKRQVRELRVHQYMNAFRAEDTLWLHESQGSHRGQSREEDSWGYIDIRGARLVGASDPATLERGPAAPVELTWREDPDPTLMTVSLPRAIPPDGQVSVEFDFVTQLPRVFARTGYSEDFHLVAQWFPKIGVLDDAAGWRSRPFTYHAEFFADFGDYEVRLDVPTRMKVGATGIRIAESVDGDRKQLTYRAEMVHDFAWTAAPDFVEHWGDYEGIRIRQLIAPEFAGDAELHLETQYAAFKSYEARFGPYPWSTITIVHPPDHAAGARGMEYPTFYTTSPVKISPLVPASVFAERVTGTFTTLHEFGHQYFQGMFASDEVRDPWLDEGLNTTTNVIALYDQYGPDPWVLRLFEHPFSIDDLMRLSMRAGQPLIPTDAPADHFHPLEGGYSLVVYQRTAALMLTLRNLVGHAGWDRALRRYAERARFAHPTPDDLKRALLEELGPTPPLAGAEPTKGWERGESPHLDLRAYFDQSLHGVAEVNFSVARVKNTRRPGDAGWHRDESGELTQIEAPDDHETPIRELPPSRVTGHAVVVREGSMRVPAEIEIEFADGSMHREWWPGEKRHLTLSFPGRPIHAVRLDPERQLLLETERHDNLRFASTSSTGLDPAPTVGERLASWTEMMALVVLAGVGP